VDGGRQRLTSLVDDLAPALSGLAGPFPAFARLFPEVLAGLSSAGGRIQQRHRSAAHCAENKGQENAARSCSLIFRHGPPPRFVRRSVRDGLKAVPYNSSVP